MAAHKFHRWDRALKQCMDVKKKGGDALKACRWRGDPLQLNEEAHDLPLEKQREALDMAFEADADLRAKLSPIWKYCFVQWHIYDAGLEAIGKGKSLRDGFSDQHLLKDIEALKALSESGELDQAKTAEKWTWRLLEAFAPAGTIDPWNDLTAAPLLKSGRAERRQGVAAFAEEHYEKAFFHFWQGLKLVARGPPTVVGPLAKLRCDLYKNQSAAALRLGLNRTALRAARYALLLDAEDPKALYRKACALHALGRTDEADSAFVQAGIVAPSTDANLQMPHSSVVPMGDDVDLERLGAERADELPLRLHPRLEPIVFVEVGIDSIAAIDMIMHLQSELLDVPLPMTLIFDCPSVEAVTSFLLGKLNAAEGEALTRAKVLNTVWRAMCRVLGADPVQGIIDGRIGHVKWPDYSEKQAEGALLELLHAYEDEAFLRKTRELAKRVGFAQRPFLLNLRSVALEVQKPILEARGFDGDAEGLRQLECAIVNAAVASPQLTALLQRVREAQQGGPNGMWAVNMEFQEVEELYDCNSIESWSNYMKVDPFGPDRKNTNSVTRGSAVRA